MRVHVVGSSGTFPAYGRPASGYVIEHAGTRVLCDVGFGVFMSLPVDSDLIDAVVISHQHPDHCADLFAAYHAWNYRPEPRTHVPLYAPSAVWDRIVDFLEKEPEPFQFIPVWTADSVVVGGIEVTFVASDHSVPTVGSRWEASNRTLFYTADTGPAGDWMSLATDVDMMLAEASYQGRSEDKGYPHHLTAGEAGEIARRAGASQLALTHIPPYLDPSQSIAEAESTFGRPVRLATSGTSFDV